MKKEEILKYVTPKRKDCGPYRWVALQAFIIKYNLKKIAEIGIYKAWSTLGILSGVETKNIVKEYWGIDPYFSKKSCPYPSELDKQTVVWGDFRYEHALKYTMKYPQFRLLRLTADKASKLFEPEYFDLVFIDGDHGHTCVRNDILNWLPLIRKGGFITGHDYVLDGKCRHDGVREVVNDIFGKENIIVTGVDSVWAYMKEKKNA